MYAGNNSSTQGMRTRAGMARKANARKRSDSTRTPQARAQARSYANARALKVAGL